MPVFISKRLPETLRCLLCWPLQKVTLGSFSCFDWPLTCRVSTLICSFSWDCDAEEATFVVVTWSCMIPCSLSAICAWASKVAFFCNVRSVHARSGKPDSHFVFTTASLKLCASALKFLRNCDEVLSPIRSSSGVKCGFFGFRETAVRNFFKSKYREFAGELTIRFSTTAESRVSIRKSTWLNFSFSTTMP